MDVISPNYQREEVQSFSGYLRPVSRFDHQLIGGRNYPSESNDGILHFILAESLDDPDFLRCPIALEEAEGLAELTIFSALFRITDPQKPLSPTIYHIASQIPLRHIERANAFQLIKPMRIKVYSTFPDNNEKLEKMLAQLREGTYSTEDIYNFGTLPEVEGLRDRDSLIRSVEIRLFCKVDDVPPNVGYDDMGLEDLVDRPIDVPAY